LISVLTRWPCSAACRIAVGTLIARSPAMPSAAGPDAGNDNTSVALFFPRNNRFNLRISASVVSKTVTLPGKRTKARASRRKPASVRTAGRSLRCAGILRGLGGESRSGSRTIIVHETAPGGSQTRHPQSYANPKPSLSTSKSSANSTDFKHLRTLCLPSLCVASLSSCSRSGIAYCGMVGCAGGAGVSTCIVSPMLSGSSCC